MKMVEHPSCSKFVPIFTFDALMINTEDLYDASKDNVGRSAMISSKIPRILLHFTLLGHGLMIELEVAMVSAF